MTHDEKIVEAVARAICVGNPDDCVHGSGGTNQPMVCNKRRWETYTPAARAAITAYQAEAWQPIETAPKDGTLILIGGWEIYHPEESPEWVESLVHWNGVCWDAEGAPVPLPNCSKWSPLPPNPPASP